MLQWLIVLIWICSTLFITAALDSTFNTTLFGEVTSELPSLQITSENMFPHKVVVNEETYISFNFTVAPSIHEDLMLKSAPSREIYISIKDDNLVHIISEPVLTVSTMSGNFSIRLKGDLPGRTNLQLKIVSTFHNSSSSKYHNEKNVVYFPLAVEKVETALDRIFTVVVILLVTITNIGLGCKVDLSVVKENLKKPFAPCIALFSQFVFMPLIAYTCVKITNLDPGVALGLFAMGCSPGGSASNAFCHLLGGDVSLSVTMTFVSTVAALGFIPMWLFTLGRQIADGTDIHIPFDIIATSLVGIILPVVIGLYIQRKHPRTAKFLVASIKYVMAVFVLFLFTAGVYINLYIFYLLSPDILIGSALLPYVGFTLGGILALVLRRDRTITTTIAIETGIQNSGVAIVLLQLSMSGPERSTAIVPPVASSMFTPIPLVMMVIFLNIKQRCEKGAALDDRNRVPLDDRDEAGVLHNNKAIFRSDKDLEDRDLDMIDMPLMFDDGHGDQNLKH